jgi:inorganic pyrophosphatase
MIAHPWHEVPLTDNCDEWFPAYIEIPKGPIVRYELDKATGLLNVDRVLYSTVYDPANYGFVPRTWCDDGDPPDELVLGDEPVVYSGCDRDTIRRFAPKMLPCPQIVPTCLAPSRFATSD